MRASLWLIRPVAASRIGVPKVRSWLILQHDVFAAYEGRIACPLASVVDEKGRTRETRDGQVPYVFKTRAVHISCDSLYTIKSTEFLKHVGDIDPETMVKVSIAVHLILGDSEITL